MKTKTSIYHRIVTFAYVLLVAVIFCGCRNEKKEAPTYNSMRTVYDLGWYQHIRVYEVDSCEYIGLSGPSDGGASIIHKHNCKFCAERSKK